MASASLELRNISKSYDTEKVLDNICLSVEKGEFLTLLGSSGCGKTTTLRIIAGLEVPDEGTVFLDGVDVTGLPPEKRHVNTVFQSYALFPHMSVEDNVGYGLKLQGYSRAERKKRVSDMLELVRLEGFEKRRPGQLSGGQRQRVAIARALVTEPAVLLLDEPLGALDLQLRRTMQLELKKLQKHLGVTFIYITHDQEEAINMSDRIVLMNQGRYEQIGTPDEIYYHPKTSYAAFFVGNANLFTGKAVSVKGDIVQVALSCGKTDIRAESVREGEEVTFAVRQENIILNPKEGGSLHAVVKEKSFTAGFLRVVLVLPDGKEVAASRFGLDTDVQTGENVTWSFLPGHACAVDREKTL